MFYKLYQLKITRDCPVRSVVQRDLGDGILWLFILYLPSLWHLEVKAGVEVSELTIVPVSSKYHID